MFEFLNFLPEYVVDAIKDSVSLIPFLFIIFVLIELFEQFFAHRIKDIVKSSSYLGPVLGALAAIVPQCGFSVIASSLYISRFISMGTLLAVYIATSDEAIPILMASPSLYPSMMKIILIKFVLAIAAGYTLDFIVSKFFPKFLPQRAEILPDIDDNQKGCCGHSLNEKKRVRFFFHPLKHTLHIFAFILLVCLIINYLFEIFGIENIQNIMLQNSIFQPVLTGIIGLIPNCAVSVVITGMFVKGIITLGSAVSGLSSSAGLGLLILIQKNKNIKNTIFIISTLLFVSIFAGIVIQMIK